VIRDRKFSSWSNRVLVVMAQVVRLMAGGVGARCSSAGIGPPRAVMSEHVDGEVEQHAAARRQRAQRGWTGHRVTACIGGERGSPECHCWSSGCWLQQPAAEHPLYFLIFYVIVEDGKEE
jgi:hypothetical protein